jgi:hypothetical protein
VVRQDTDPVLPVGIVTTQPDHPVVVRLIPRCQAQADTTYQIEPNGAPSAA